jgi:XTP/dITP diphosphohydrolase
VISLRIGTQNSGKLREFKELLTPLGYRVRGVEDLPGFAVVEDGQTFEENALKKARAVLDASGEAAIGDDSGLVVDALGGAPGIHSARYAGVDGPDQDARNREKLLHALRDVPEGKRSARFVCVLAYCDAAGLVHTARGEFEGAIGFTERGTGGFGYDSLFVPRGSNLTAAELPAREKNQRSHRGQALRDMVSWLKIARTKN